MLLINSMEDLAPYYSPEQWGYLIPESAVITESLEVDRPLAVNGSLTTLKHLEVEGRLQVAEECHAQHSLKVGSLIVGHSLYVTGMLFSQGDVEAAQIRGHDVSAHDIKVIQGIELYEGLTCRDVNAVYIVAYDVTCRDVTCRDCLRTRLSITARNVKAADVECPGANVCISEMATERLPYWRQFYADVPVLRKHRGFILDVANCWDDIRDRVLPDTEEILAWDGWQPLLRAQIEMFLRIKDTVKFNEEYAHV